MHDYNYDTLANLDKIITHLKNNNYIILPFFNNSITLN